MDAVGRIRPFARRGSASASRVAGWPRVIAHPRLPQVGSGTGAPTVGSGGNSSPFALALSPQRRRRSVRHTGKAPRNGSAFTGANHRFLCPTDGVAALPVGRRRRGSATAAGGGCVECARQTKTGRAASGGRDALRGQGTHVPHRRRERRWEKTEVPTGRRVKTRTRATPPPAVSIGQRGDYGRAREHRCTSSGNDCGHRRKLG